MPRKILAVDDDALLRRSLAFNLERSGFTVQTASCAEDALEMARQTHPDLIIMDIGLPGMDGLEALRTWGEAAINKKLDWQVNIPAGLPEVQGDPDRLGQALGNLVSNAIRYTPGGGKVQVSAVQQQDCVEICVEDSGPGIALDEQKRIFQPFYRGKAARRFSDGMGLGLPIARDLVEAHGGALRLESTPCKGSRFLIDLPEASNLPQATSSYRRQVEPEITAPQYPIPDDGGKAADCGLRKLMSP